LEALHQGLGFVDTLRIYFKLFVANHKSAKRILILARWWLDDLRFSLLGQDLMGLGLIHNVGRLESNWLLRDGGFKGTMIWVTFLNRRGWRMLLYSL
jgi:hypothetical protein